MQINVRADFSRVRAFVDGSIRQVPFATARALTNVARKVASAEQRAIGQVFDNPLAFTRRGVGITSATKTRLRAEVFLKRKQAAYLAAQIKGGPRRRRPFEAQFGQQTGQNVQASVPGAGAPLDSAGNLRRSTITRLGRQVAGKRGDVFEVKPGGQLTPGIYQRTAPNRITPLLIFSQQPARYSRRFDFFGVARQSVRQEWSREFARSFTSATRTAR